MYNGSEDLKQALKSKAVTTTARIKVLPENTIIDGNNLVSIKITDKCYENGILIGTAMTKEVEIEIINNNYDLEDKEFSLEVGVLLANGTYEYIPFGNFTVKEYKDLVSNNHYNIIAYDYMDKLNATFVDNYDYSTPITLQTFYENFANFYNIEIATQTLPNQNFIISTKPYFEGMSGRTVLSRIAEMFGSFAKFNRENKLQMYLQNTATEKLSRNEMNSSLQINEKFGPINVVALRLSDIEGENVTLRDETSIATYGENVLQISDNPFVYTQALREAAIQGIFDRIKGFSYYPTEFNFKIIYYDGGDIVEVQDMNTDDYYPTIILNQTLQIPNTIKSKCQNLALTKTGLTYQFVPKETAINRRTEYIVDKQAQKITQILEEQSDQANKLVQIETSIDGINTKVSSVETKVVTIEGDVTTIQGNVSDIQGNVSSIEGDIGDIQDNLINLQAQIDGAIQFWNGSEIPTINNYPASEWTTEADRNNHRADIYTVIQDIDGELKQGKSYRFDKVGDTWQWIELTDNELSAVQALATSKAKVFVTTPTVPYSVGDLWLNNGKLYRCKTAKDSNGSYSSSDWEIAVDYTDDTVAELAKTLANNAQSTANSAVEGVNNITNTQGEAEGKNIHIEDSSEEPFVDVELYGETSQKTRSGSNLLKDDFAMTAEGTTPPTVTKLTGQSTPKGLGIIRKITIPANNSTSYAGCRAISPTVKFTPDSNGIFHISYRVWIKTSLTLATDYNVYCTGSFGTAMGTINTNLSVGDWKCIEFNNHSYNFGKTTAYLYLTVFMLNTSTEERTIEVAEAQMNNGTLQDWEQYGVMPSPDYPSEIENIEGKNKFKTKDITALNTNLTVTTENNKVTLEATTTTGAQYGQYIIDGLDNTKQYTLSFKAKKIVLGTEGQPYIRINLYGSNDGSTYTYIGDIGHNSPAEGTEYYFTKTVTGYSYYRFYIYNNTYTPVTLGEKTEYYDIQFEEGTVATPYVPYNSLEFKIEGKNILDLSKCGFANCALNNDNKSLTCSINNDYYAYVKTTELNNWLLQNKGKKITFSTGTSLEGKNTSIVIYGRRSSGLTYQEGNETGTGKCSITIADDFTKITSIELRFNRKSSTFTDASTVINYAMLGLGEPTDYEPYKSQVAYFPLSEGQKLMEGSYTGEDGIHNARKQVVLNGSEKWQGYSDHGNVVSAYFIMQGVKTQGIILCDRLKRSLYYEIDEEGIVSTPYQTSMIVIKLNKARLSSQDINGIKTWLSENPITVEYELAEEEITPYTNEQRTALEDFARLTTYKNITNITSDAYAKVIYMRDNGLDVYETKQNAQKNYTETTAKFSEVKNTIDSITSTVSETVTRLNNDYMTADQTQGQIDTLNTNLETISTTQSVLEQKANSLTFKVENIETNGVSKVTTSMGYTFDDEGFKLNRSGAETGTLIDEAAIRVIDKTGINPTDLLYAGYVKAGNENYTNYVGQTIVAAANMIVKNYLIVPNSRFEAYINPVLGGKGTGVFGV